MKVYEFGKKSAPALLLLPGTCCHWKGNFGRVIPLLEKKLLRNPATGGWRLTFTVRLPKEEGVIQSLMAARKGPVMLRFRALLKKGENLPDPLTETWVYDWQLQQQ